MFPRPAVGCIFAPLKPAAPSKRNESVELENDEALMEQYCAGNQRPLEVIFDRHSQGIRRLACRLLRNQASADDVVQATFLSVVRSSGRFRHGARFQPWLYAIATNACRDLRRRNRSEVLSGDDGIAAFEATQDVDQKLPTDPGLRKQIQAAIEALPDAQREAIVLSKFEGLSYAEIAQGFGLSESAIKVRAHRGIKELKRLLAGAWEP